MPTFLSGISRDIIEFITKKNNDKQQNMNI